MRILKSFCSSFIVVTLIGCGGGESNTGSESSSGEISQPVNIESGQFKDSNVSGLKYTSGDQEGITSFDGGFVYVSGEDVKFTLGGVSLGSTEGNKVVTPIDLVTFGSSSSDAVLNRVRFLMMLDLDGDANNGIEISNEVQLAAINWADTDFTGQAFETSIAEYKASADSADAINHVIPTIEAARDHVESTFYCVYSGAFKGRYDGGDAGAFGAFVDSQTGMMLAVGYSNNLEDYFVMQGGSAVTPDYQASFVSGNTSTGATFSGRVDSPDAISGNWNNSFDNISGNFAGERFGGSYDAKYRFSGTYEDNHGNDRGIYSIDVDSSNVATGTAFSIIYNEVMSISGLASNGSLVATSSSGASIIGTIDFDTLQLNGSWSQPANGNSGTYQTTGCRLN
jgi:hypothetical protein